MPVTSDERRAVDVRRLRRHVELQAAHRVEVRHASARLERRRMAALEPHALIDTRFGLDASARAVPSLSPTSQWIDVVGLLLAVRPEHHLVRLRRERIGDDRAAARNRPAPLRRHRLPRRASPRTPPRLPGTGRAPCRWRAPSACRGRGTSAASQAPRPRDPCR